MLRSIEISKDRSVNMRSLVTVLLVVLAAAAMPAFASAEELRRVGSGTAIVLSGVGSDTRCTLGVAGYDDQNRMVGLTAAHCGGVGSEVVIEDAPHLGSVGTVVRINSQLDSSVVLFDALKVVPANQTPTIAVNELGSSPRLAQWVCKEGETTGNTCGFSIGHGFARDYNSISIVCVAEGDSGGPVVAGNRLIGIATDRIPKGLPVAMVPCPTLLLSTDFGSIVADLNSNPGFGSGFRIG